MIVIKSKREIGLMRKSGEVVAEALAIAEKLVRPGIQTEEIDRHIEEFIKTRGGQPAFKGFNGFPSSTCISVENQVVHGIPGKRRLKEGEIVSIDVGVKLNGYYGDAARTFVVGEVSSEKRRLMDVTRQALYDGIEEARAGNRLSDISHAVQTTVENAGYSVVRDLVGHGIGREMHEAPQIPNFGSPHRGPRLRAGMVFAIEPMVNMGGYEVYVEGDRWTVVTKDRMPSAHFEHTVAVTEGDPLILTEMH